LLGAGVVEPAADVLGGLAGVPKLGVAFDDEVLPPPKENPLLPPAPPPLPNKPPPDEDALLFAGVPNRFCTGAAAPVVLPKGFPEGFPAAPLEPKRPPEPAPADPNSPPEPVFDDILLV
jgi:hypothetical protein